MAESKIAGADRIDVQYVARLARLHLTEEEIRTFQAQLDHILSYVRQLSRLDLSAIEPTSHARPLANVFRKDVVTPGLDRDDVLRNAPANANEQFSVPKIVE
jgi:aspartyl-tRNA(Asn)/glutamyl-tRNA(Gln) amidotransferase subunit C